MKYKIQKRPVDEVGYPIEHWPWRLIYPDGTACLCFSHRSAVGTMNDALRNLKSDRIQFLYMARKYNPNGTVEVLVK